MSSAINDGDVAWMLMSTALVMVMTPALGFFYGGLARAKNVLNTLMMSYSALGVITMVWFIIGYSLAFGPGNAFLGGGSYAALNGVTGEPGIYAATIPHLLFCVYQLMFAIITPALVSGSMVERTKYPTYLCFLVLWSLFVYDPVAHWVWSGWTNADGTTSYGWLRSMGVLDFAGGLVVHLISGTAGMVAAYFIGPRKGFPIQQSRAHSIPFVVLGVSLIWFGWFGFNGGSALAANALAVFALMNTQLSTASAMVTWIIIEYFVSKPSTAGAATAAIVGLIVITPASGFVQPWAAVIIGIVGALICFGWMWLKSRFIHNARMIALGEKIESKRFKCTITWMDDSLDAFGCHGLGGSVGAIMTGLFATTDVNPNGSNGAFYGDSKQLGIQLLAVLAVGAWSAVVTAIIFIVLKKTIGLRTSPSEEEEGMDKTQHHEEGYFGFFKMTGIEAVHVEMKDKSTDGKASEDEGKVQALPTTPVSSAGVNV